MALTRWAFSLSLAASALTLAHEIPQRDVITGNYQPLLNVAQLPMAVRGFFEAKRYCPGIANPADAFNSTDLIEPGLACRRLMSAGHKGVILFVHYEAGGRGHTEHIVVFRVLDGHILDSWSYLRTQEQTAFEDLQRLAAEGDDCLVTPPREHYVGTELETCLPDRAPN